MLSAPTYRADRTGRVDPTGRLDYYGRVPGDPFRGFSPDLEDKLRTLGSTLYQINVAQGQGRAGPSVTHVYDTDDYYGDWQYVSHGKSTAAWINLKTGQRVFGEREDLRSRLDEPGIGAPITQATDQYGNPVTHDPWTPEGHNALAEQSGWETVAVAPLPLPVTERPEPVRVEGAGWDDDAASQPGPDLAGQSCNRCTLVGAGFEQPEVPYAGSIGAPPAAAPTNPRNTVVVDGVEMSLDEWNARAEKLAAQQLVEPITGRPILRDAPAASLEPAVSVGVSWAGLLIAGLILGGLWWLSQES